MAVSTATQLETIHESSGNQVIKLQVDWEGYKQLDDKRGHQPGTRFTFSEGVLQIMSVGFQHERLNRQLATLVDTLAEAFFTDFEPAGGTTLRREDMEKGFEPDSCFYFTDAALIRGKDELKLGIDPPPDLIIEIDITSSLLNRLPIFAAVGVSEVWRYEKNGVIKIYQLHGELYDEAMHSRWFPMVSDARLGKWLAASLELPRREWLQMIRTEIQAI